MKNANMPAMPCEVVEQYLIDESQAPKGAPTLRERKVMGGGMTKREIMAMHMMSQLMMSERLGSYEEQAGYAIKAADALLAELEHTK